MPWLKSVAVSHHFKAPDFQVDLSPEEGAEFKHLILTGPNGSGKTTILNVLAQVLGDALLGRGSNAPLFSVDLDWTSNVRQAWKSNCFVAAFLSMHGPLGMNPVQGPVRLEASNALPGRTLAQQFLQYLVNQQVQARLAREDDPAASDAIFAWFAGLERALGELFDIPGLRIKFLREKYDIRFEEPSGLSYGFSELPSGFASVLRILAEIVLRVDALGIRSSPALSGVVIIDEIDAFLHPELEKRVLPFLTRAYPRLQFVVATHSPAVAVSLRNAMIVSLGTGKSYPAELFAGVPYGNLLASLFGLENDVDLETTHDLHELVRLWELPERSPDEQQELGRLADALQKTGNAKALEIWLKLRMSA